jgi:hypothetical protein
MAEQIKNTLAFDLAPGASVTIPHGLKGPEDQPLTPDIIHIPSPDLDVSADGVDLTLTNKGGSPIAGAVLVEWWHTIERGFGGVQNVNLPVKPYIVVSVESGNAPPQPPFDLTTTIIYARPVGQGGSDVTGKGTLAQPYLTFQRAIRDVPSLPAPGARFIVDITGIGTEVLPDYYVLPNIQFPTIDYQNDFTFPYFYSGAGLRIRALPKLVTLPGTEAKIAVGASATVSEDADTKLITLTIPLEDRTSWTMANLRNKKLIRTVGSFKAGCVIVEATHALGGPSTLVLTNSAENFNSRSGEGDSLAFAAGTVTLTDADGDFTPQMVGHLIDIFGSTSLANDGTFPITAFVSPTQIEYANGAGVTEPLPPFSGWHIDGLGALILAAGEELQIVEPSATLEGGAAPVIDYPNEFGFAGIISACNSIAFQGLDITNRSFQQALGLLNSPNVPIELCNVAGLFSQGQAGQYFTYANGTLFSYGLVSVSGSFFATACHFDDSAGFPFFFYVANGTPQTFNESIFTNCDTFTPGEQSGLSIICNTAWQNVLMTNCGGIIVGDGRAVLDHVQINTVVPTGSNPTGDGVRITEAGFGRFVHVTGTGITGYGAIVGNGSQLLADLTTTIGNPVRAYTNGSNAPVLAWAAANNVDATQFSRVNVS